MRSLAVGWSGSSGVGLLLAVILSAMAAGRPVAAQFKLAGSPDGTLPILVDDGLDVYVNDVQVHTDGVQASGLREPFPIGGAVGDTVRLVVRDTYGVCAQLTPVFIFEVATGRGTLLDEGFHAGCGNPNTDQGIVYDQSRTIHDLSIPPPLYDEIRLPASAWAGVVPGPGGFLYGVTKA